MKNKIEAALLALKKQKSQTNSFTELLEAQLETAKKIGFSSRAESLNEIIDQESFYLSIINLKIQKCLLSLKKFV
jgi:hypothetical protein